MSWLLIICIVGGLLTVIFSTLIQTQDPKKGWVFLWEDSIDNEYVILHIISITLLWPLGCTALFLGLCLKDVNLRLAYEIRRKR